jgi:hypothetical protein
MVNRRPRVGIAGDVGEVFPLHLFLKMKAFTTEASSRAKSLMSIT